MFFAGSGSPFTSKVTFCFPISNLHVNILEGRTMIRIIKVILFRQKQYSFLHNFQRKIII